MDNIKDVEIEETENEIENEKLSLLRNTLLPKLMSGKINVGNLRVRVRVIKFAAGRRASVVYNIER